MQREPILLYIFRAIIFAAILFFLGMLYWSNSLVERDLKGIRTQIAELNSQIETIRIDIRQIPSSSAMASTSQNENNSSRPHILSQYPNLLEEDPFYKTTLPTMLGKDFRPQGIRKQAILGHPEHLHPFNGFVDVRNFYQLATGAVAQLQFGKYETLSPSMAIKMEERPISEGSEVKEFWVHLRDNMFWEPLKQLHFPDSLKLSQHFLTKHKVTAHDFKFYFDAVMNPHISEPAAASFRTYLSDIEEFRVIDDLTFVVRWKSSEVFLDGVLQKKIKYSAKGITGGLQPLPRFVYQYFADGKKIIDEDEDPETYRKNSIWAQNFTGHFAKNVIVSCGPWIFDGFSDQMIRFKRNPDYFSPYAALSQETHYYFKESFEGIWQAFKAGKIDFCNLAPSQLPELTNFLDSSGYEAQKAISGWKVDELNYVDRLYYYVGWNQSSPLFKSVKVRQALSMAIDQNRIIEQNLNAMGIPISGPFFRYSPSYDPTIQSWPYDPLEAKRILEEEGWIDRTGDGVRDNMINGKLTSFRFSLTYYVKNSATKVIAEYIQTCLKEIGIDCRLNGVDVADLSHSFEDKSFDAIYLGWSFGTPPEDPKQLWHSSGAKEKGSSNGIGFANKEADALIENLQYEYDKNRRLEMYHRFHKIIHDEAPYVFLYSPINKLLYRDYVKNIFIPLERQDLVPGANIPEPDLSILWLAPHSELQ